MKKTLAEKLYGRMAPPGVGTIDEREPVGFWLPKEVLSFLERVLKQ